MNKAIKKPIPHQKKTTENRDTIWDNIFQCENILILSIDIQIGCYEKEKQLEDKNDRNK